MEQRDPLIAMALNDLAVIRRAVERAEESQGEPVLLKGPSRSQVTFEIAAFCFASGLLAVELYLRKNEFGSIGPNSWAFLLAKEDKLLQITGLFNMGALLFLIGLAVFFSIKKEAVENNTSYNHYVARNITYLSGVSFYADLLVKFVVVSIVVLSDRAEIVPACFTLFTADYLFQGRLFRLPFLVSILLGIAGSILALWQALVVSPDLVIPLAYFLVPSTWSLIRTWIDVKRVKVSEGV